MAKNECYERASALFSGTCSMTQRLTALSTIPKPLKWMVPNYPPIRKTTKNRPNTHTNRLGSAGDRNWFNETLQDTLDNVLRKTPERVLFRLNLTFPKYN